VPLQQHWHAEQRLGRTERRALRRQVQASIAGMNPYLALLLLLLPPYAVSLRLFLLPGQLHYMGDLDPCRPRTEFEGQRFPVLPMVGTNQNPSALYVQCRDSRVRISGSC
jgi:hypothetical protein